MDSDEEQSGSREPSDEEDLSLAGLLKRPTSMPQIGTTMRGFAIEQEARDVGNAVLVFMRIFGTFLNLERLDAVIVAFDYDAALAEVERGFPTKTKLTKTHDDFAVGVAMTPVVMRDGKACAQMVINAAVVYSLKDDLDSLEGQLAVHVLAHEAAHVHNLAIQDRAFPSLYQTRTSDFREKVLFGMALGSWDEYIASRLSAPFGRMPERIGHFESTFCSALDSARERGKSAIIAYRSHGDVEKLVSELVAIYGQVMELAAYLLGHLDGLEKSMQDAAPKAHNLVQQTSYFEPTFQRLEAALRGMHDTYGRWSTLDVFDAMKTVAEDLLKVAGIRFVRQPTGNYWVGVDA